MTESQSKKIEYREMEIKDVDAIVDIHLKSFQGGILAAFGVRFLKRMYCLYLRSGNYGCVATSEGRVIGYCLGTSNAVNLRSILDLSAIYKFIFSIILDPRVLLGLLSGLKGSPRIQVNDTDIELSHIALDPDFRSLGIGTELVNYFEKAVGARGFNSIISRTHNQALSNYYIREKAASVVSKFKRSGVEYTVLKWKLEGLC